MKYVFIAGLEHSGTTLTDHLLSQHPRVLGLGEVASFFSPAHMRNYMNNWASCPDVTLCSCGRSWNDCPFWAELMQLNGLNSDWPLWKKYGHLFQYIRSKYKYAKALIDSSKDIHVLNSIIDNMDFIKLKRENIFVVFVVKDVRSFSASISKKSNKKSLLGYIKTFNLWHYCNNQILQYLCSNNIDFVTVLYEELCLEPESIVDFVLARIGLELDIDLHPLQNTSHIAMGNKQFTIRNKDRIRYDATWYLDDTINFAYLLQWKVRRFNKNLYGSR